MSETSERHKLRIRWKEVKTKWDSICVPVIERYHSIKMASQVCHFEFKNHKKHQNPIIFRLQEQFG